MKGQRPSWPMVGGELDEPSLWSLTCKYWDVGLEHFQGRLLDSGAGHNMEEYFTSHGQCWEWNVKSLEESNIFQSQGVTSQCQLHCCSPHS